MRPVLAEDFLPGHFTKYNNIFGAHEKVPITPEDTVNCSLAAAFSHFTWIASGYNHIILDVQVCPALPSVQVQ